MERDDGGKYLMTRDRRTGWAAKLALAAQFLVFGAACSQKAPPSVVMDAGKVGSVVVGRSTRSDVFAVLGQPSRTERSALGEAWIYEAKTTGAGGHGVMNGVSAASAVVGAFVPYVGLVGSGLGLADAAFDETRSEPELVSLTVAFRDDSVVRDCAYSSTATPVGMSAAGTQASRTPGLGANIAKPVDCQRPAALAR